MIYFGFYSVWYDWFLTFLNSLCGCCGLQKKWSVCQGSLCRQRLGLLSEFYFGWLVSALQRICPHFCLLKTCTVGFKASCDELHANPCETKAIPLKVLPPCGCLQRSGPRGHCILSNDVRQETLQTSVARLANSGFAWHPMIISAENNQNIYYIQISEYSMLGRCSFFCGLSQLGFYDSVSQSLKPGKICWWIMLRVWNMIRQVHSGLEASSKYNNTTNLY